MKQSNVKERIIETASSLFYKNGYNSTGINEIISEANIAKATLYSHFKSKEDICIAYLRHKDATFRKDIKLFCDQQDSGKLKVLSLFDFLSSFFQDSDFNGCWCIKTVSEIPKENERVRAEIQQQKSAFIQFIAELLKETHPGVESDRIDSLARRIYLLYEGAVAESHLHQADWPIKESKSVCEVLMS